MIVLHFISRSFLHLLAYLLLTALILTDIYISKENKRLFVNTIILCFLHLLLDFLSDWSDTYESMRTLHAWSSYVGYMLRPLIIYFYARLLLPERNHRMLLGATILNLIMYATTDFTKLCVYFTEGNRFQRGPLAYVVFYICGVALMEIMIRCVIAHYKKHLRRWILPPISTALIVLGVYSDFMGDGSRYPNDLNNALVVVVLLFYLYYHLELADRYEKKMVESQQLQLMVSQIKPHFFFNMITTIQALCYMDPKKAADTLGLFASYVRYNITPQGADLIPFDREIQHVKTYVSMEILRFPNIEVRYDLQTTDFDIAMLSIQPLVENAIKHGLRSKDHGIVLITTRKSFDWITITIRDNGTGFDLGVLDTLDETHVGINNVRNRLKLLLDADMEISSDGNGTTVVISIPREYK